MKLHIDKTPDLSVDYHKNKVNYVNDVPTEDESYNACNDLTLLKSGNGTANPRGEGNDSQNEADES